MNACLASMAKGITPKSFVNNINFSISFSNLLSSSFLFKWRIFFKLKFIEPCSELLRFLIKISLYLFFKTCVSFFFRSFGYKFLTLFSKSNKKQLIEISNSILS